MLHWIWNDIYAGTPWTGKQEHWQEEMQSWSRIGQEHCKPIKGQATYIESLGRKTSLNYVHQLYTTPNWLTSWVATPTMQSLLFGITCPSDSLTVEWPNLGVTRYAPWFSEMVCVKFRYFEHALTSTLCQDLEAIRCISNVPHTQTKCMTKTTQWLLS